jgi:RNA ligase (TIGR02306 family)
MPVEFRKMVTINPVVEVKSIPGADLICAYRVKGWWVVDQVGKYNVGDLVLYAEIDSWIPHVIAPFLSKGKEPREYNGVKGERLRTVKLKGQVSQGLILPMNLLDSTEYDSYLPDLAETIDVSDFLNVQKWEAPIPANLRGQMKGNFPAFIRKTDQERCQNLVHDIAQAYQDQVHFEVSLKLDGSSCTVYHNAGLVGVCSRNLDLELEQEGNSFVEIAKSTGLLKALIELNENIAVQGELMGPGIQGNKEGFDSHKFFIFDIFDIDNQCYFVWADRMEAIQKLRNLGYTGDTAPALGLGPLESGNIEDLLEMADGPSINAKVREGLVFKRTDGQFSFKAISQKFLLNEK